MILALLLYIAGGLTLALGAKGALHRVGQGEALGSAGLALAIGAALVVGGAIVHLLSLQRREGLDDKPGTPSSVFATGAAVGIWLMPLTASWIQFEMHADPVWMFPLVTLIGAIAASVTLSSRVTYRWVLRPVATMLVVGFVGMPVGFLSVALPLSHFTHHLTTVQVANVDRYGRDRRPHRFEADVPSRPSAMKQQLDLFKALANAKPVDVEAEIAAGRMRREPDGSLVTLDGSGNPQKMRTLDDVEAAMKEARERREQARQQAFNAKRDRLRQSGRLFSGPGVLAGYDDDAR